MFRRGKRPAPAEAVHVSGDGKRSKCGQPMDGEQELAQGTAVTCPRCCSKNGHHACGCGKK